MSPRYWNTPKLPKVPNYLVLPVKADCQEYRSPPPRLSPLDEWITNHREIQLGARTIGEWTTATSHQVLTDAADASLTHKFKRRFLSSVGGRSLITTQRGFIGLANNGAQQGDPVYIFMGWGGGANAGDFATAGRPWHRPLSFSRRMLCSRTDVWGRA